MSAESPSNKITINFGKIKKSRNDDEVQKIKLILRPPSPSSNKEGTRSSKRVKSDGPDGASVNNPSSDDTNEDYYENYNDHKELGVDHHSSPNRNHLMPSLSPQPQEKSIGDDEDDDDNGDATSIEESKANLFMSGTPRQNDDETPSKDRRLNMAFLKTANYSSNSLTQEDPGTPFSPKSPGRFFSIDKRKTHPVRAIPQASSLQQRIEHQIIRLEFIDDNSEDHSYSNQDAYLKTLLTHYRSKNDIHRIRMRRRHERIMSRNVEMENAYEQESLSRSARRAARGSVDYSYGDTEPEVQESLQQPVKKKRGRGRPPKNPPVEQY
jgi:hypothetical protein